MQRIRIKNATAQEVGVGNAYNIVVTTIDVPHYQGSYVATPTQARQTFSTGEKYMEHDFVVEPIPNNYGLITYNGFGLTVS